MREKPKKIRTKQRFSAHLKTVENNPQFDLKDTKGIKKHCPFNELNFFHILDNNSIDIMHDMNEGVIPFFLQRFITFLISSNTLNFVGIQAKIRDFHYGFLNEKYYPSKVNLKKHNLGQSAVQLHNLMIHTPFIFAEYKSKIPIMWKAMENLLQIMQIIYSSCISDGDIERLKRRIEEYLSFLVDKLQANLTPKHHNMTHYPTVIRKMGPLIHMWMMRMECKHKVFTDMVRRTNNYINLPKTLALQHQEILCKQTDMFTIAVEPSKTTYNIAKTKDFDKYEFCMPSLLDDEAFLGLEFLKYGTYEYRSGFMIINNHNIFEIVHVFQYQNKNLLLCHPYLSLGFETCYNSLEIEKDSSFNNCCLLPIYDLENKKTYEKHIKFDKIYVIADTLDVFNKF